ncbi:hypothetical protein LguiB_013834 [Lonicera macranthoides]
MNGYSVNANVVVPIPGAPHPVAVAPLTCFRARFPVFSSEGLSVPTYKPTTNTSTRFEIHIINGFPTNSYPLRCRCQSKDTDFGYHELLYGEEFIGSYQIHIVNGFPNNSYTLRCRCQSKDTDFGYHDLARGKMLQVQSVMLKLFKSACTPSPKVRVKTGLQNGKGFEIHIVNGFSNNSCPLRCRCQSKDTDFGYHELLRGEEFYWKFHNHVFEKTLYFCHFYWGNMDKVFDVFNDRKAFPSCADGITTQEGKCYWLVKNDGFYSCKDKCEPNNLSQWNKTSKDNDLGNHDLQRNEEFYWKFHIHVFGRTLYFCHFYWGDIDKSVDVFNDKKRFPSCDDDKSPKRPAKPQPRNIYPHGFVSGSSRPASQGVTHPEIALFHYSLNFGVFMGSEATSKIIFI